VNTLAPGPAVEKMIISNTEAILNRAAEIDEVAWMFPLRSRLNKRREASFRQAKDEFILSVKDSI
jgi:hypothetical protein